MEYILISQSSGENPADSKKFSEMVTQKLKEGFELYGHTKALYEPQINKVIYTQGLLKNK